LIAFFRVAPNLEEIIILIYSISRKHCPWISRGCTTEKWCGALRAYQLLIITYAYGTTDGNLKFRQSSAKEELIGFR